MFVLFSNIVFMDNNTFCICLYMLYIFVVFRNHRVVSSFNNTFNKDFGVEIDDDDVKNGKGYNYNNPKQLYRGQMPGISIFIRNPNNNKVYHSYSTFSAGLAELNVVFSFLDILPEGRAEKAIDKPEMWWIKHKENYD